MVEYVMDFEGKNVEVTRSCEFTLKVQNISPRSFSTFFFVFSNKLCSYATYICGIHKEAEEPDDLRHCGRTAGIGKEYGQFHSDKGTSSTFTSTSIEPITMANLPKYSQYVVVLLA